MKKMPVFPFSDICSFMAAVHSRPSGLALSPHEMSRALGHPASGTMYTVAKSALGQPPCLVDPLT